MTRRCRPARTARAGQRGARRAWIHEPAVQVRVAAVRLMPAWVRLVRATHEGQRDVGVDAEERERQDAAQQDRRRQAAGRPQRAGRRQAAQRRTAIAATGHASATSGTGWPLVSPARNRPVPRATRRASGSRPRKAASSRPPAGCSAAPVRRQTADRR